MSEEIQKIQADQVITLETSPIKNGVVILDGENRILDVLDPDQLDYTPGDVLNYNGILCPGFVNTHCHLELSYLKDQLEEGSGLDSFIRNLTGIQASTHDETRLLAAKAADQMMLDSGIVAVLDITDSSALWQLKQQSAIWYHQTIEVFGTDPRYAAQKMEDAILKYTFLKQHFPKNQLSVSPHSPYALSDELFGMIFRHAVENNHLMSLHHLENEDEIEYYLQGTGRIPKRQEFFGINACSSYPKGQRPAAYLAGNLNNPGRILFVHNTMMREEDLHVIADTFPDAWFSFCPNANYFIERRLPDLRLFKGMEHRMCLGTDSLASNHHLSILEEIRRIQQYYPETGLEELLYQGCLNGARFLGIDHWAGSLKKGKAPGLVLLENVDSENLTLRRESVSRLLTRYLPF